MNAIPEPTDNTKHDDASDHTSFELTPMIKRLLVLNFILLLLIAAGLFAVIAGLGHGFWLQVGQVFFQK